MTSPAPAKADSTPADGVTPMMAQYLSIKTDHADALLFYRMGDFYELFFEDAVQAAAALDIALTKRGKHLGDDIPMCGVPVHSHDSYLARLIKAGFKVAVCEQTEDPAEAKKRGSKAVVRRDVVRVVTPGTLTEETLLDSKRHNWLVAVAEAEGKLALAWADMSVGDFQTQILDLTGLGAALARLSPGEVLAPERLLAPEKATSRVLGDWRAVLTPLPDGRFDSVGGAKRLGEAFKVASLEAFGSFARAELAAAGAVIAYLQETQKGRLPYIAPPKQVLGGGFMEIDAATRRNLELTETLNGSRKGSLLEVLDRTVTGPGARLFARRLSAPLTDLREIQRRLAAVQFFAKSERLCETLREALKGAPDMERALSRITLGRGGPRDLAAVRDGLKLAADLRGRLLGDAGAVTALPGPLADAAEALTEDAGLIDHLGEALAEELPLLARDGGFIRSGFDLSLDDCRMLRDESRRLIAGLQAGYQEDTGVSALKIKHNNVLGYFIELPARHADRLLNAGPDSPYIHRQTLANAVRFTTVDLSDLEGKIAKAADQALAIELDLFKTLVEAVIARAPGIAAAALALAQVDVYAALAVLACQSDYACPEITEDVSFDIVGGRHPVVERALKTAGEEPFVANDCRLEAGESGRLWLLTGPNMAGKSTYLRQNALIALMAQVGSFVPATRARIGLVDRLFSRVGAADDLARGRSTFMVEMVETAAILNQATERSLVILDEIGRGTATFDGLSIAWAVVEQLHDQTRCRALFATHYHELTQLSETLEHLSCHSLKVKEWQGDVVFLHAVAPGAADRSYGIHVARLAGLPDPVIARAQQMLELLERYGEGRGSGAVAQDLPLFAADRRRPTAPKGPSRAEQLAAAVNPDQMTPREALDWIYALKEALDPDKG